jgi:nicotinamidase-related amidase
MENAFVLPGAPFQIKMALDSVPACARVINGSRQAGIPVFFVKRIYRANGTDIENSRWERWNERGRAMTPGSTGIASAEYLPEIKPRAGDYQVVKPRWSAFFATELDLILRRLGIETVVLIGTTTPNCIRSTCYDADSLDYEVVVVEDACSSNTPEIQAVNMRDMENMGATILSSEDYVKGLPQVNRKMMAARIREDIASNPVDPEPITDLGDGSVGWTDRW